MSRLILSVKDPHLGNIKLLAPVFDVEGNKIGEIELPELFYYPIRKDIINRAFLSAFTAMLQPKGRDPLAGKRTTAKYWGVGYGLARVPRLPTGEARFVVSNEKRTHSISTKTDKKNP